MKILLVQPSHYLNNGTIFKQKKLLFPVLTMPTIASYTPGEHNIEIVNDYVEEINYNNNYDLIGITAKTTHAKRAYDIADEFRKHRKAVVMGGMHVSALPDEALEHCDAVAIGEAEYLWPSLVKDFENGKLQRIYKTDKWHDMKGLPVPRFDLIKTKAMLSLIPYQATRGCPFNCDFCAVTNFYGKTFRYKPVDEVIDHIRYIKERYKPNRILFSDDNITCNSRYALELFEKLIPLKLKWSSQADIRVVKRKDVLSLAKKSGCTDLYLGIESVNQLSLDSVGKSANKVESYKEVFSALKKARISFKTGIILGLDGDDNDVFVKTLQFVNELKVPYPTYSVLTPFPGTRLRERLKSEGRLLDNPWVDYNYWDVTFKPKLMSVEELVEGHRWLFKKTYSIPSILKRCTFPLASNISQTTVENFYNFLKLLFGKQVWE